MRTGTRFPPTFAPAKDSTDNTDCETRRLGRIVKRCSVVLIEEVLLVFVPLQHPFTAHSLGSATHFAFANAQLFAPATRQTSAHMNTRRVAFFVARAPVFGEYSTVARNVG
jgi:hypothetical protein